MKNLLVFALLLVSAGVASAHLRNGACNSCKQPDIKCVKAKVVEECVAPLTECRRYCPPGTTQQ